MDKTIDRWTDPDGNGYAFKDTVARAQNRATIDKMNAETADRKSELDIERKRIDNLVRALPNSAGEYQQSKMVLHGYGNAKTKCGKTSRQYTNVPAFTTDAGGVLSSLYTKKSNYQIAVNKAGLYLFELRIHINSLTANKRVELAPFVNGERNAALASSYNTAGDFTMTKIATLPMWLSTNDTIDFRITPIEAAEVSVELGDVLVYAIDWDDKFKIPDYTGYVNETKDLRVGVDGTTYDTAGQAMREQIGSLKEDLDNADITRNLNIASLSWKSGNYINSAGYIADSDTFAYSEPIMIFANTTVIFTGVGYQQNVAMIAKNEKTSDGKYTVLVKSDGDKTQYTYSTDTDIEIILSCKFTSAHEAYMINGINAIEEKMNIPISELRNGLLKPNLVENFYLNTLGRIISYDGWSRTNYICCKGVDELIIETMRPCSFNCFFKTTRESGFIENFVLREGKNQVKVPEGANFFMLSNSTDALKETIIYTKWYDTCNRNKARIKKIESVVNESKNYNDISTTDGYFSNSGGLVTGDDSGFQYTDKIFVPDGYTISVIARGYQQNVAMIGEFIDGSYNVVPLVISDNSSIKEYMYTATKDIYVRCSGNKNAGFEINVFIGIDTKMKKVENQLKETKEKLDTINDINYIGLFHRIGGIGDSLMSGEIAYYDETEGKGKYIDRYESSWLSNICRRNGLEKVHYSQGGMTVKAWLNGNQKTTFEADKVCNAYFIALGTNDLSQDYPIGNINDVSGTNSFVGYYKQIIDVVKAHAPNCCIFLMSLYNTGNQNAYSSIISQIANLYDNCYYVDFINNTEIYTTTGGEYSNYGHFTTLGYMIVSYTIEHLVNKIVKENLNDFKFFSLNN